MTPEILILSGEYDFSTDLICDRLRSDNVPYLRLNREHLGREWQVALDPVGATLMVRGHGGTWTIASDTLRSVWFRQPVFLRNACMPSTAQEQFERSQWMAFLRGLSVFDQALWVNHPQATYLAESKPYQLLKAANEGFLVPQTIITNDARAVKIAGITERFMLKAVDTILMSEGDENVFPYSSIVDMDEIIEDTFASAPSTCQVLLSPKLDLRVTVIGDIVHSVRIVEDGTGVEGDWRLRPRDALKFEPHPLSGDMRSRCVALTKQLGLAFAAFDFAETPDGIFFIEVNPTGEWGWLNGSEGGLERALCDLLRSPRI